MGKLIKYLKNIRRYQREGGFKKGGVVHVHIDSVKTGELLKNKTILITGGSGSIGKALAKRFATEGATVIITGRDENKLKSACDEIGYSCRYYILNLSDLDNIDTNMTKLLEHENHKIDVLVNNAGIGNYWEFFDYTQEEFDRQYRVDLGAVYFLTQSVIKNALQNDTQVNILNIASNGGILADPVPYSLYKAGVIQFTRGVAKRYAGREGRGDSQIRCNCIAPGVTISTIDEFPSQFMQDGNLYTDDVKNKRALIPEELAEVALFLVSDESVCVNGQVIACDGGHSIN